ncbi:DEAD/DEAH box helicase [Bailinhaonella thermotolerans]|uniref:DEAD/DEAH box helicase n=1 Tax=Bailinhaonella thermotolerans TaxID=1070861 RepID=UPI002412F7A0|nr:DEAD/DEAH box helicase [Bailinhaonella thermotolerans]
MTVPAGLPAPRAESAAFELLHPRVRRWLWEQGWRELRQAQEAAVAPVLAGDRDVLIAAATATGKTEAAFLPICSSLAADPPSVPGFWAVYVSPLKALINDQHGRLDALCENLEIPVARWHGDVAAATKGRLAARPRGILLITPESLEALFVLRGPRMGLFAGALRYVVVDELHSFIGTERGAQLRSLLHRLDLAARRRVPRIGLSATLGDLGAAAEFLRPGGGDRVERVVSTADGQEVRLQLRGYVSRDPRENPGDSADPAAGPPCAGPEAAAEDGDAAPYGGHGGGAEPYGEAGAGGGEEASRDVRDIARHLFQTLRGGHHLVFANSRSAVEQYTDLLTRESEAARVPNEFVPHHGNLSKDIREHTEARLKDRSLPATAICTSTLEMGIDIGSVSSVAQIGAPPGVAALRQRLGRSGRRDAPAVLRLYVSEPAPYGGMNPADELRDQLVQTIATVDLLLERWYEPPPPGMPHLSTLTQQVLSLIAQHGGVTPAAAHRTLCAQGPFREVGPDTFAALLRDLAAARLIRQEPDGLLLHGEVGERIVNHHTFYAAFATPVEYRVTAGSRALGTLPVDQPVAEGSLLLFAGRRWRVLTVDPEARLIDVAPASGGRPPTFTGAGPEVHDRVRVRMREVYESPRVPAYLDAAARLLLDQGRAAYRRLGLGETPLLPYGKDTLLFPFRGDRIMTTLTLALAARGVDAARQGLSLLLAGTSPEQAKDHLTSLAEEGLPSSADLARHIPDKRHDKYDFALSVPLLTLSWTTRHLDLPATESFLATTFPT